MPILVIDLNAFAWRSSVQVLDLYCGMGEYWIVKRCNVFRLNGNIRILLVTSRATENWVYLKFA